MILLKKFTRQVWIARTPPGYTGDAMPACEKQAAHFQHVYRANSDARFVASDNTNA
jgi:hypothetical protein